MKISVFVVFIIVKEWGDVLASCPNCLFDTKVNNTSDAIG